MSMVYSIAEELYREARELMRAARIPQITTPFRPTGRRVFTSIGKAMSGFATVPFGWSWRAAASCCPMAESGVLVSA